VSSIQVTIEVFKDFMQSRHSTESLVRLSVSSRACEFVATARCLVLIG
jgi:hypothetical protein